MKVFALKDLCVYNAIRGGIGPFQVLLPGFVFPKYLLVIRVTRVVINMPLADEQRIHSSILKDLPIAWKKNLCGLYWDIELMASQRICTFVAYVMVTGLYENQPWNGPKGTAQPRM